jgi:hypothetical protein
LGDVTSSERMLNVKLKKALAWGLWLALVPYALAGPDKDNGRKESLPGHMVDSGTFGVFVNGRRVATETFSVQQDANGSVVKSDFKSEPGAPPASQSSELQLSANGDLIRYEWKEVSPGQAHAFVVPNDSFLVEHSADSAGAKEQEHPFLLPVSTSILDDYFFVDREILAWKYLATGCRQEKGQLQCPADHPTQFGVLDPHSRSSMLVSMQYAAREPVSVHGVQRELNRLELKSDSDEWSLWLDDQFKLIRIVAGNTEIVRD